MEGIQVYVICISKLHCICPLTGHSSGRKGGKGKRERGGGKFCMGLTFTQTSVVVGGGRGEESKGGGKKRGYTQTTLNLLPDPTTAT